MGHGLSYFNDYDDPHLYQRPADTIATLTMSEYLKRDGIVLNVTGH